MSDYESGSDYGIDPDLFDEAVEDNRHDKEEESKEQQQNSGDEDEQKKKRKIKPKKVGPVSHMLLSADMLCGDKGLSYYLDTFKDFKFQGKEKAVEDLDRMLQKIEHWLHVLFPKHTFEDNLQRVEQLGPKRPVKTMVKRIRMGIEFNQVDNEDDNVNLSEFDANIERDYDVEPRIDGFDFTGSVAENNDDFNNFPDDEDDNLDFAELDNLEKTHAMMKDSGVRESLTEGSSKEQEPKENVNSGYPDSDDDLQNYFIENPKVDEFQDELMDMI